VKHTDEDGEHTRWSADVCVCVCVCWDDSAVSRRVDLWIRKSLQNITLLEDLADILKLMN